MKEKIKVWTFRGFMCALFFAIGLCSGGGCSAMKAIGPELLKVVCPRCAQVFEALKGTGHGHAQPDPSIDGADPSGGVVGTPSE